MLKSLSGTPGLNLAKPFVWRMVRISIVLLMAGSIFSAWSGGANEIKPGELWLDTGGRPINAHGGGMLFYQGTYYWYGEDKSGRCWMPECNKTWEGYRVNLTGVRCYSSQDLRHWKDEGLALKAVADDPTSDLHTSKVCERPKVIFNERTKKFVMWMHIESMCYDAARAGVAVADHPTGPFTYLGCVKPEGQDSRDQTLFLDQDGKAYRIYASEKNQTTYISLLTDDYLKHSGKFARIFVNDRMEAQCVFKHAGKYWLIGSHVTGWDPNPARAAVADSIWGPWTDLGNPCSGPGATNTFGAQSAYVFQVAGRPDDFVFMADRWNKKNLPDSRYVWLPIHFTERDLEVAWRNSWLPSKLSETGKSARERNGNVPWLQAVSRNASISLREHQEPN